MSDDPTLPPVVKNDAAIATAFIKTHWVWCGPLIGVLFGWIIAKVF